MEMVVGHLRPLSVLSIMKTGEDEPARIALTFFALEVGKVRYSQHSSSPSTVSEQVAKDAG